MRKQVATGENKAKQTCSRTTRQEEDKDSRNRKPKDQVRDPKRPEPFGRLSRSSGLFVDRLPSQTLSRCNPSPDRLRWFINSATFPPSPADRGAAMFATDELRPATSGRKPLGKLASRLEEVKNPWRQVSTLELSHNEAARLATDALLEHGESEYRRVLGQEREVSFLSQREIQYITQHAASKACGSGSNGSTERDIEDGDAVSELTSGTYFPMMSDEEPPLLELGWPEAPQRYGPSQTQIYFQREKSHNIKDTIRSLINQAKKVIAVVMDVFTDVDLMCDLMEASNKRRVPVYILLDERNLSSFTDMCSALDIQYSHLSNMRLRSVCGDTYCTKSGKKFTGQVLEKFMIIDCEEVIAGSYSFTWLSSQVHTNMVMHFTGHLTEMFDREFRCLYADSQIIDGFFNPDEDGMPYYTPYQTALAVGASHGLRLDLPADRIRARPYSDNSSSQSSNSVSSVKMAPGMASNAIFKGTHDKKEPVTSSYLSPQRRDGGQSAAARGPANAAVGHTPVLERSPPGYVQPKVTDWNKPNSADGKRPSFGGVSSKIQGLTLYDSKPGMFHNNSNLTSKAQTPSPVNDGKLTSKQRSSSNQFLNKLSDRFQPSSSKDKDSYNFGRSPSPHGPSPWGGPDLSQPEPESQQSPPPPTAFMKRNDQKRMTLGHSKLELVNEYNKRPKPVYSRFELKSMN